MRIVFALLGAALGFVLVNGWHELFGLLAGGCVGFALAESLQLGTRIDELESELDALSKLITRRPPPTTPTAPASVPPAAAAPGSPSVATPAPSSVPASGVPSAARSPPAASPGSKTTSPSQPLAPPGVTQSPPQYASREETPSSDSFGVLLAAVRDYFTGGNTLVRVGIIILFFGVAFLLRYVAEHSHIPIEFRLCGVALGGIVLLALGWRLRSKRLGYALALQGGGVGILYLTIFASLRIYSVLRPDAAFALLAVVAAFSAALAILQSSQAFALLAVTGGFLAPTLTASESGSHVVLFSYYAVLNAGILAIAWFKAWRALNVAGFLFTFVIGTAWGVLSYQPGFFPTTEPFLILFFLFYVAIAILFSLRQAPELRGYVDGTLVFGTPIVVFGLQSALVYQRPFALAYSALAASALYLALAWIMHIGRRAQQRLLVEAFLALGVLFATLAVPLALDGRWTAATWALEGGALVWVGCRQDRRIPRAFGALLQLAGGLIFWNESTAAVGSIPVLNSAFVGGVMISAASTFSAAMLERSSQILQPGERLMAPALFFWGLLWWLLTGLTEIQRHVPVAYHTTAGLAFVAATALLCSELNRRATLAFARLPALWLLPAMVLYAALTVIESSHPFANGGWIAWPAAFAAFYVVCKRHEGEPGANPANLLHAGSAWLLVALLSWELEWAVARTVSGGSSWSIIAWALVPAVVIFRLPRLTDRVRWPFGLHQAAYVGLACAGLAVYLAIWSAFTNVRLPGDARPLPFVPLLNPLDLAQLFVLLVLLRYCLYIRTARFAAGAVSDLPLLPAVAVLTFIWLNAALLRAIHHLYAVPFEAEAMFRSTVVETSVSIFWAALALATMLFATRKGARPAWLSGAGLLAVVIVKLFLIDLSHIGTVARIVSFVGVGLLMLVIGYFSPMPPARDSEDPRPRAPA